MREKRQLSRSRGGGLGIDSEVAAVGVVPVVPLPLADSDALFTPDRILPLHDHTPAVELMPEAGMLTMACAINRLCMMSPDESISCNCRSPGAFCSYLPVLRT
jgi:hypothetical protein